MTAKQTIDLVKAILDVVEKDLLDPTTGNFLPADVSVDLTAAADVEEALKAAGLVVPTNIDKVFAIVRAVALSINVK